MRERIAIIQGDITKQKVDAIVNAANSSLVGGGGVDGAIHSAAGPALDEECRRLKGCDKGEAKITKGYNLPARWVIHTVGPVWHGGRKDEDEILARCYRSCFKLADQHKIRTLAFPSISTGAYHFPVERAAKIALRELKAAIKKYPNIEKVSVVCFDKKTYDSYVTVSEEIPEE